MNRNTGCIYSVRKNTQGGISIVGIIGVRNYCGYSPKSCRQKYVRECERMANI